MEEQIYNKDYFYANLWFTGNACFYYDRCLEPMHLEPLEDFLLKDRKITPFSNELSIYKEARKCVLDFDIYALEESYRKGNESTVELLLDCYRYAANSGVTEAYNNIGVFYAMTDRLDKALSYWKRAALNGSDLAWINLMNHFYGQKNYDDVFLCLNKLKELKNPVGYWNLALIYHFGLLGVHSDINTAEGLYKDMMSLGPRNDKEKAEEGSNELLHTKTMACYNLARMRFMTEEHTKENLDNILFLLTETPYVLSDQARANQLIEDIKHCCY